jgi:hypothetical protein
MKRAKKTKATALDQIAARVRTALRSQTKNVIEIGKLLIESREHLEHGEWQAWLAENFDLTYRTAINYTNAAEYVARKGKSETVSHFANLSPTVLYRLAGGDFDERVEAAILAEARERRVDEDAMWAICEKLAPPDDDDADDDDDGGEDGDETAAVEDPEITAIIDGPPPKAPPTAPNPPPIDYTLRDFDQAISVLNQLKAKLPAQFAEKTTHSIEVLESVELFIHAVMKARTKAKPTPEVTS